MRIRTRRHAVAITVALALGGALTAAPAQAHVQVISTNPTAGSTAKTSLQAVRVLFNGPIRTGSLRVTGPGGTTVSKSRGGRDPRNIARVMVALRSGLKAGGYTARWTAVAADGHQQRGSFSFKLRK